MLLLAISLKSFKVKSMGFIKKRLHVISIQDIYLKNITLQLDYIFGDKVEVVGTTIQRLTMDTISDGEMIMLSKDILKGITSSFIPDSCTVLVPAREVNIAGAKDILNVPIEEKILIINDTYEHALETAESLKQSYYGFEFIAYNPVHPIPEEINYIVTPGEIELVPGYFSNVIDIGPRILDYRTIVELAEQLGLDYPEKSLMNRFFMSNIALAEIHKINATMPHHFSLTSPNELTEQEIDAIRGKIEEHGFLQESLEILSIYKEGKENLISFGRAKVKAKLQENGIPLTDQQLRLRIEVMQNLGLVHARQGRGGTKLSEKGEEFLQHHLRVISSGEK